MPSRTPIADADIEAALPEGWRLEADDDGNQIIRDVSFEDFREAFAFLTRVAFEAEAADHHPEIANVYNQVSLAFSTHDADNRVTETDLALATRVNALLGA